MNKSQFRAQWRALRVWFRGDWSAPRPDVHPALWRGFDRRHAAPSDVYHSGYTARDSLRDRRFLKG